MKKLTKIIIASALLVSGLFLTSCGFRDAITQTYDKWYKYTGTATFNVPLGTTDDEDGNSSWI